MVSGSMRDNIHRSGVLFEDMPRATGQITLDNHIMDEVHNVFESLPEGERTAENKALLIANAIRSGLWLGPLPLKTTGVVLVEPERVLPSAPRESSGAIVLDTFWKQPEGLVNQAINQALLGEKDTK